MSNWDGGHFLIDFQKTCDNDSINQIAARRLSKRDVQSDKREDPSVMLTRTPQP
jgi:hypothetical protein